MAEETTPNSQPEEQPEKPQAKAKAPKSPRAEGVEPKVAKAAKAEAGEEPKAKAAKKATVEDKPFADFIPQDYLPALEKAFGAQDIADLKLSFANNQVSGQWLSGQRQFTVYFPEGDINAQRAFSCSIGNVKPSTIEPFLGDERKITLDLLVFGVMQRINAQKWFGNN